MERRNAVVLYSRELNENNKSTYEAVLQLLRQRECDIVTTGELLDELMHAGLDGYGVTAMEGELRNGDALVVLSIGGDGTFLEAAKMVIGTDIPILGINRGRLGFLSDVSVDKLSEAVDAVLTGNYRLSNLDVLALYANYDQEPVGYAINEFAVSKCDNASMLTIRAQVDGDYLTTYWADGLIIATATGSTAYSMSVGGPIVSPSTPNFIITPIAPHNLTVRPLIVPNTVTIQLQIEGRGTNILTSLDGRNYVMDNCCTLRIVKTPFDVKLIHLQGHSFFATLRDKLMWGADSRNI